MAAVDISEQEKMAPKKENHGFGQLQRTQREPERGTAFEDTYGLGENQDTGYNKRSGSVPVSYIDTHDDSHDDSQDVKREDTQNDVQDEVQDEVQDDTQIDAQIDTQVLTQNDTQDQFHTADQSTAHKQVENTQNNTPVPTLRDDQIPALPFPGEEDLELYTYSREDRHVLGLPTQEMTKANCFALCSSELFRYAQEYRSRVHELTRELMALEEQSSEWLHGSNALDPTTAFNHAHDLKAVLTAHEKHIEMAKDDLSKYLHR